MNYDLYERALQFSPIKVRLLAQSRKCRAMTDEEIGRIAGMSAYEVFTISLQFDWTGIDIYRMQRFTKACNVDFSNQRQMNRVKEYLSPRRNVAWQHLRLSPHWKTYFEPLMARYLKHNQPTK